MPVQHMVIVGMMAAGKTTLGLALAEHFGLPYLDSDEALSEQMGQTGKDLADREGVEFLHSCEATILLRQLAEETPSVISAAASTIDDAQCRDDLAKGHRVCWLDAPAELLLERLALRPTASALAAPEVVGSNAVRLRAAVANADEEEVGSHRRNLRKHEFELLFARRVTLFAQCATVRLDARLPVEMLVALVMNASLERATPVACALESPTRNGVPYG